MAAHGWRRAIGSAVRAGLEASLALDPGAYAAVWQMSSVDELETETIGVYRPADRVAAQGRPVATALQIATGS